MRSKFEILYLLVLLSLTPSTAFAYLDPGTATVVIQSIIAAAATAWLTAKLYWHRLVRFFTRKQPEAEPDTQPQQQEAKETDDQPS